MAAVYEAIRTADKGYGIFATQDIAQGSVIIRERPAVIIPKRGDWGRIDESHIVQAVDALDPEDREKFLSLYEDKRTPYQTREARIFHINCFGANEDEISYVYLEISRANHSCAPNAADFQVSEDWRDGGELKATRVIKKGEEICISYKPEWSSCMTRVQRRVYFQTHWGFYCQCNACDQNDKTAELSDVRRKIICGFRMRIYQGKELPQDFFDSIHPGVVAERLTDLFETGTEMHNLVRTQHLGLNALLAKCLEAEGLSGDAVGDHYFAEAFGLLTRLGEKKDNVVFLSVAKKAMHWLRESIAFFERIHGEGHSSELDQLLKMWEKNASPELKISLVLLKEGKAALTQDELSVEGLMSRWETIGTVLPQPLSTEDEEEVYSLPEVFAFWFGAREDHEPIVSCLTHEQYAQFVENQKNPLVLAQVKQQADAFLRRWAAVAEGQGLSAYIPTEDEASECVQS